MQVEHSKPGRDPLKPVPILGNDLVKANKTILVEKNQQNRSIFSVKTKTGGNINENQQAMQEAIRTVVKTTGRSRLIDWKEDCKTQSYDKVVCGKIGSSHFKWMSDENNWRFMLEKVLNAKSKRKIKVYLLWLKS